MINGIIREITPLAPGDCFAMFSRKKSGFTFPLHNHEEMELNLILNAGGSRRIIGDHINKIGDVELVLIGPNLPHGWFTHQCRSCEIQEVTIQFHQELFSPFFLQKNELINIRKMFEDAKRGLLFSPETVERMAGRIFGLDKKFGFDSVLELLSILHNLSTSKNSQMLSDISFTNENYAFNSRRIERVFAYMNREYDNKITLATVAKIAHMSEESFSRFIKIHTGHTFTENLTEIRLGHVSRMLINTSYSVGEIAGKCGFYNMANFNRIFKERKGCTPREFKYKYIGQGFFA